MLLPLHIPGMSGKKIYIHIELLMSIHYKAEGIDRVEQ